MSDILTAQDVDSFTRKLKATLEAASRGAALLNIVSKFGSAKASASAAAPRAAAGGKGKGRRTRQPGLSTDKVLNGLKGAKDGFGLTALAQKIGESNKERVAAALRKLRDAKKAVVKGEKSKAVWFAA